MQTVNILGPTIVDGRVRHLYENPLRVRADEARRLREAGLLPDEPAETPDAPAADI